MATPEQQQKFDRLSAILKEMGSVMVALSGGVDSTFLTAAARRTLGKDKMAAATACSATFPRNELKRARKLAGQLDVEHVLFATNELEDHHFTANPPNRCYFCKRALLGELQRIAEDHGFALVADGTNADDVQDFRPGLHASEELGIRQPLREAGLTKADIRALSAEMELPTHDLPAAACLATRIPYGEAITEGKLRMVERAEELLRGLGFRHIRVRTHGTLARVELGPEEDLAPLLEQEARRAFVDKMKAIGYKYVALDLEGYRTGSMNEVLSRSAGADSTTE